jgi:parallel beta-helix repeat protein
MDKRFQHTLALTALAVALATAPALGAEGRMPLWQQTVLAPGVAEGKFIVTRDITPPPGGGTAISIIGGPGFEHADIDLNGFTVSGDPAGGGHVIEAFGLASLTVRNGELRQTAAAGLDGIRAVAVSKVVVEDVKVANGGIGIFLLNVEDFALRRNIIVGSQLHGILVDPAGGMVEGTIEGNQVRRAIAGGIEVLNGFSSLSIRDNRVEEVFGGLGISVMGGDNALIAENTVQSANSFGIRVEACSAGKLHNNVVNRSGVGIFIRASNSFLVLDNVASDNMGDGLFIDGATHQVDRNVLNGNLGFGLHFTPGSADNTYSDNSARGNGGGPCAFMAPVEPCPFGGGGSVPPDFCNESPIGNTSRCDNLMPGPPLS